MVARMASARPAHHVIAARRDPDPVSPLERLFQEPLEARTLLSVTPQLIDLNAAGASSPSDFVEVGDATFFVAEDATYGRELWKTDGTPEGTSLVADIRSGSGSSDPAELVEFNGELFFVADDGVHGRELWVVSGTSAGLYMVKDIHPERQSSYPTNFIAFDGRAFFWARDGGGPGYRMWATDGTEAGTCLISDRDMGEDPSYGPGAVINGRLVLWNRDAAGDHLLALFSLPVITPTFTTTPANTPMSLLETPYSTPARARVAGIAATIPSTTPTAASLSPWPRTSPRTWRGAAPRATRRPISCRRCSTE